MPSATSFEKLEQTLLMPIFLKTTNLKFVLKKSAVISVICGYIFLLLIHLLFVSSFFIEDTIFKHRSMPANHKIDLLMPSPTSFEKLDQTLLMSISPDTTSPQI